MLLLDCIPGCMPAEGNGWRWEAWLWSDESVLSGHVMARRLLGVQHLWRP